MIKMDSFLGYLTYIVLVQNAARHPPVYSLPCFWYTLLVVICILWGATQWPHSSKYIIVQCPQQCFCFRWNIGEVTPEIVIFLFSGTENTYPCVLWLMSVYATQVGCVGPMKIGRRCRNQCFFLSRHIAQVTPKKLYSCYNLKQCL